MRQRLRGFLADTRPLSAPAFRRLWLANIVTVIGAQLTVVAVPAQIYSLTNSSAWVGLTGLFGLVPLIVFGLWGGAVADSLRPSQRARHHHSRADPHQRAVLGAARCGATPTCGCCSALFAVQQAFFAVNQPTRSAVLPAAAAAGPAAGRKLAEHDGDEAGAIAGPLVGGALIPVVGFELLYLIDTLMPVRHVVGRVGLPTLAPEGAGAGTPGLRAVLDGLRYLLGHPVLLISFLVDVIAMVFGMPRALFPQIAHVDFGGPAEGVSAFALLFAAIPAGAVVGGRALGLGVTGRPAGTAVVSARDRLGCGDRRHRCRGGVRADDPGGDARGRRLALAFGGAADMASAAFRQ